VVLQIIKSLIKLIVRIAVVYILLTSKPDFKVIVLLLVFMQLTRDLFAIAKFLLDPVNSLAAIGKKPKN